MSMHASVDVTYRLNPARRIDERTLRALIDGLTWAADHRPCRSRSAALLRDAVASLHNAANALRREALN